MKSGTKQTASHSSRQQPAPRLHSGGRRSKARAPCQQQAKEAIRAALPMPTLNKLSGPRHM